MRPFLVHGSACDGMEVSALVQDAQHRPEHPQGMWAHLLQKLHLLGARGSHAGCQLLEGEAMIVDGLVV